MSDRNVSARHSAATRRLERFLSLIRQAVLDAQPRRRATRRRRACGRKAVRS
jgi:hypothetical protein